MAAYLVLALVMTSMPARVWLFGACPICGQIHEKVFVADLGGEPKPSSDSSEDSPFDSKGDCAVNGCFPPLPYCPTSVPEHAVAQTQSDSLHLQSDAEFISLPPAALIRPPRA